MRRALEDVALGHLDRVEPEQRHRLDQDQPARDDRRRAVRMQPGHVAAARASGSAPSRARIRSQRGAREAVAVHAVAVVGLEARARSRRTKSGVPATAMPSRGRSRTPLGHGRLEPVAHRGTAGVERLRRRRVASQVALGEAHRPDLGRDEELDLVAGADDQLGAAAADVEHQQRLVVAAPARRAQIREPRLALAGDRLRVEAEPLAAARRALRRRSRRRAPRSSAPRRRARRRAGRSPRRYAAQVVEHARHRGLREAARCRRRPRRAASPRSPIELLDQPCRRRPRRRAAASSSSRCRRPRRARYEVSPMVSNLVRDGQRPSARFTDQAAPARRPPPVGVLRLAGRRARCWCSIAPPGRATLATAIYAVRSPACSASARSITASTGRRRPRGAGCAASTTR